MNLKRSIALAAGTLAFILAKTSFGFAQNPSPLPDSGAPQTAASPQALPPPLAATPAATGVKLPLRLANTSTKSVDVYIEGGLKCKIPASYKCDLEVPPGRYSIRFVRSDGDVFNDSFQLPQTIEGKEYKSGIFVIKEDRVEFGAGTPRLTPPPLAASPAPAPSPHP